MPQGRLTHSAPEILLSLIFSGARLNDHAIEAVPNVSEARGVRAAYSGVRNRLDGLGGDLHLSGPARPLPGARTRVASSVRNVRMGIFCGAQSRDRFR